MKEITMTDKTKYLISDETFQKLKNEEMKGLIYIKEIDEFINLSFVLTIGSVSYTPYWGKYQLNQNKTKIYKDGSWQSFDKTAVRESSIVYKDKDGNEVRQNELDKESKLC